MILSCRCLAMLLIAVTACGGKSPDDARRELRSRGIKAAHPILLRLYVERGDLEVVELLLEAGVDPDTGTFGGWRVLHTAVNHGHTEIAKLLLKSGANPLVKDKRGRSPLNVAVEKNSASLVKLLLSYGASFGDDDKALELALSSSSELRQTMADGLNAQDLKRALVVAATRAELSTTQWLQNVISNRGHKLRDVVASTLKCNT